MGPGRNNVSDPNNRNRTNIIVPTDCILGICAICGKEKVGIKIRNHVVCGNCFRHIDEFDIEQVMRKME